MSRFVSSFMLLVILLTPARAQLIVPADEVEFEPDITGQGEKMNYGPFLSYSLFGVGKEGKGKVNLGLLQELKTLPVFLRPVNINLGDKHWACFDTEMCTFGCAWSGGPPNINRSNLNGYKGSDLAYLRLPSIFQNRVRPGWSLDGSFKDPRSTPHGALPKNIAHYKGLYLHGDKVILSYTVGKAKLLDMPMVAGKDKEPVFCRILHIQDLHEPIWLMLPELSGAGTTGAATGEHIYSYRGSYRDQARLWLDNRADGNGHKVSASFETEDAPEGKDCNSTDLAMLKIFPSKQPIIMRVFSSKKLGRQRFPQISKEVGTAFDLPTLCRGGPARWKDTITVSGQLGNNDDAYTVDTIPLPFKNPWNSWIRPGGFDFFKDGRVALCTWNGDVWIGSGLDETLKKVTWKRFATGLFEPMGLRIVDDVVYVAGKDQITKLHDLNGDGEADFYENFNNDAPTAASYHSFALELQTDKDGNFYYLRGAHRIPAGTPLHGGMIKVAKDGSKAELICTGIREANGMSIGPDGTITAADNQGNWVPSSRIDLIRPGKFYGYRWEKNKEYPKPENPLCWIPMKEDNSSGGQVWVTSDKWGPLKGDLLHTSYGTAKLFQVFMQRDGDRAQGGVAAFPLQFNSGIMRARFHPIDGQLYVCGLKGWSTAAKEDGGFQRVRYTGKPVNRPKALRVDKGKIAVTFTEPLDPDSIKLANVKTEQWNYRWTASYGSKDYSALDPKKEGRDPVEVKTVRLAEDRKTIVLEIPSLRPVMQMGIELKLRAADGKPLETTIYHTINYLP